MFLFFDPSAFEPKRRLNIVLCKRKLTGEKIDELWYLCGFVIANHEKSRKALSETAKEDIIKNLAILESG